MGNAIVQLQVDGKPVLSTDPWLIGRAYYDSWALHHPLTEAEIQSVVDSKFIWISHGHPDHMHLESLALLPKGKKVFVPNHYSSEIASTLKDEGFDVEVMEYKKWYRLTPELEILCLDNINQDAVLVMRFADALLFNINDSPHADESSFLRSLVKAHPNNKVFAFKLVGVAADMLNYIDANGQQTIDPPENYKMGCIQGAADQLAQLGVKHFCISSSQHIYVRPDSRWANNYDFSYDDYLQHWHRESVSVLPPFISYDLTNDSYERDWPQGDPDPGQFIDHTGEDNWENKLSTDEWTLVEGFFQQFETIRDIVDFVDCVVGGECRRVFKTSNKRRKPRGVRFHVPRESLLETAKWGYFDDLLIGNFMKTELISMKLYPDFSPRIAKYGGNAKVYTRSQLRKLYFHYFRRNPVGMIRLWAKNYWDVVIVRKASDWAESIGIKRPVKWLYLFLRK